MIQLKITPILLLLFNNILIAQNFEYKVSLRQVFSEKGLKQFENMTKEKRDVFLQGNQSPPPIYYSLFINNKNTMLSYIPSVNNQQEKSKNQVNIAPFGFYDSFRKSEEPFLLMSHPKLGKNIYSKIPTTNIEWTETNKDSIILNYKVKQAIGTDKITNFNYKIWYTKELPKGLGIYNLKYDDGFIIAFKSVLEQPDESIDKIIIEAFPYKNSKIRKNKSKSISIKINSIKSDQVYTQEEINTLYNDFNKKSNEMLNSGVDTD